MDVYLEKEKIRRTVLEELEKQPLDERQKKSSEIIEKLRRSPEFQASRAVMFYAATPFEVDTIPFLKEVLKSGRVVFLPFVDEASKSLLSVQIRNIEQDLIHGTYGILEPRRELVKAFDINHLDLVLVPGLAFDRKSHRLGRGKGYYDRFLKTLPAHVKRWGLAFDFQLFDSILVGDADAPVDRVITNDSFARESS